MTFDENLNKLNEIVNKLESDKLSLEEALDYYKEGIDLSVTCKKTLETAKLSVKKMSEDANNEQAE